MTSSRLIIEALKAERVSHVVGLPDNSTAALFSVLNDLPEIHTVSVTREGEAFAIAAGLWVGGARPIVVIQNTGFFESGDAIRGCVTRMRIPLVCLIGYRGYKKFASSGLAAGPDPLTHDNISRPDIDSCALLFEPTLKAWGIPYDFLTNDDDVPKISRALRQAEETEFPVALLITEDMM